MGRSIALALAVLIVAAGLSGCAREGATAAPRPEDPALRIAVCADVLSCLVMVAADQGYFSEQGLNVTVEYPGGTPKALSRLHEGAADLVCGSDTPFVVDSFTRPDLRVVATLGSARDEWAVVARRAAVAVPSDLRGKTVATLFSGPTHYYLHNFLVDHDLSERSVDVTFSEEAVDAFVRGEYDAIAVRSADLRRTRERLGDDALTVFEEKGVSLRTQNLIASRASLDRTPRRYAAAMAALLKAETYVAEHPEETWRVVAEQTGESVADVAKSALNASLRVSLDQSLLLNFEDQARWAEEYAVTTGGVIPDYLTFIDPAPLETVAPDRVTLIH